MRRSLALLRLLLALTGSVLAAAPPPADATRSAAIVPDLGKVGDAKVWRVINGEVRAAEEGGRRVARLAPVGGNRKGSNVAMALVEGAELTEGTFEVDLRGDPAGKASFVGVAFGVTDGSRHEAVYFRPFNFRSEDPVRRGHSVQYVSWPEFTWEKLRAEKTGIYESAVAPSPDPTAWFHARIEVTAARVTVFVGGADRPCLDVQRLGGGRKGGVGLWVDSQEASFADFRITPRAAR
jgi:hypothetical protein